MPRIPYNEYQWSDGINGVDYSFHKLIECPKHPENKYSTKGPGRSLHMIGAGLADECSCPLSEHVVITDGDSWTTTIRQDIGAYQLSHSGPSWHYAIFVGHLKALTFEDGAETLHEEVLAVVQNKYKGLEVRVDVVD